MKPAALSLAMLFLSFQAEPAAAQAKVIELTQVPCQFLESERGKDRGFKSVKAADCEAINAQTGERRLAEAKTLELKPGKYVFRVTNKNVPYELGFWLAAELDVLLARIAADAAGG